MDLIVSLNRAELNYDVAMSTHVISNREFAGGASEEQAWNYSNTEDESGEFNLISRYLESASNDLIGGLAMYMKEEYEFSDNILEETEVEEFMYVFDVPENYNRSYLRPLRSKMHDYIVHRTLYRWFLQSKPNEADKHKAFAEEILEDSVSLLNKRNGLLKIRPYPHI